MASLDGIEAVPVCPCGFENFERITVRRPPNAPIVTDFVACVGCRAMFYLPKPSVEVSEAPRAPMPSGSPTSVPGMMRGWGAMPAYRPLTEQSPEELDRIREAAARANKSKKRR